MKYCEGCYSCTKPCGKQEKAWNPEQEDVMTKYEKIRIVLSVVQIVVAVFIAFRFGGV